MKVGKVQFIAIIIMFFPFLIIVSYYNFQLSAVNPADSEDILLKYQREQRLKELGKFFIKKDLFVMNLFLMFM